MGISEFKGKTMINIREYYEKDGESLPGKKVCVMVLLERLSDIILWIAGSDSMATVSSADADVSRIVRASPSLSNNSIP